MFDGNPSPKGRFVKEDFVTSHSLDFQSLAETPCIFFLFFFLKVGGFLPCTILLLRQSNALL